MTTKRKLTPAEENRVEKFNQRKAALEAAGYRETERTINIIKANVFALFLCLPLIACFVPLFCLVNREMRPTEIDFLASRAGMNPLAAVLVPLALYLICMAMLIVLHELIHGIAWSIFAPGGFRDIEFGFIKENLTPYCFCYASLRKGEYLAGALMPLIILGIVPALISVWVNSVILLGLGIIMIMSAGGDILVAAKVIGYRSDAAERLYNDYPTEAGVCVFEK